MPDPLRILFLCTGNSCRSQMAEGFARALHPGRLIAASAGTRPQGLNPLAVRVMAEAAIDISRHASKHLDFLSNQPFDAVITVCDAAAESCPAFPGSARRVHQPFDDPPALARGATSDAEALPQYRRVRDQIRNFIERLPEALATGAQTMTTTKRDCGCDTTCCGGEPATAAAATIAHETVREQVRAGYGAIAENPAAPGAACGSGGAGGGGCCGNGPAGSHDLAATLGYSAGELASLPDGSNMGLSCGNPTAIASLRPGEVVLDLGSGGGLDCFVAGPKVGTSGRVIGVDMTPQMLTKARRNLTQYAQATGLANVEFRLGEIEHLPVPDASVDVVISNCVLNLSPDKPQVWREIARVLKPRGRIAVSDLALLQPLPGNILQMVEALIGCIAGAVLVSDTERQMRSAGLTDIRLTPKPGYMDAMSSFQDPLYRRIVEALPKGTKPGDYITSLDVAARKP